MASLSEHSLGRLTNGRSAGQLLCEAASLMLLVTSAGFLCLEYLCLLGTEAVSAGLPPTLLPPSMLVACGLLMT